MEKNMQFNFEMLEGRVLDALDKTDLEYIRYELGKIDEATLTAGVGGSSVVSEFAAKVLQQKNGIITRNTEPRDFAYNQFTGYKNVVTCSYGGRNYGVRLSFTNALKHYLLSAKSFDESGVTYLKYNTSLLPEKSFISLGATLIPISVLMNYYLDGKDEVVKEMIREKTFNFDVSADAFEIFTGIETSAAAKYLESTLVEAGIGIPVIHDKYSFCHGRSTLATKYSNSVIYFNGNTEMDRLLLRELPKYYREIVVIESDFSDQILADYDMLIQAMYLTKYMAEKKAMDLSGVDYSPIVKLLYKYEGEL